MKEIYLIRHSGPFIDIANYEDYENADWNEYNRNMILSPLGEEKAKELTDIEELNNIDSIYSSDSYRAIGTAKYLAESNGLKIKLDDRINERHLGCNKIADLPDDFSKKSFEDKDLKHNDGESLYEVDKRFNEFIDEIVNNDEEKTVVVIHGMILMSFLQQLCKFRFKDNVFTIRYKNKLVMDRKLNNPDVFKIQFEDGKIINIENITKEETTNE